ncbi:MAG TPA: S9 family peptidase [Bacteroidales bacterium]|nr:S9 family peptidase [Bacteroidales bacterium]
MKAFITIVVILVSLLSGCKPQAPRWGDAETPVAERILHEHILHGDTRPDFYYWVRDRENPAVIDYLEAENAYFDARMAPLAGFVEELFVEMQGRIRQDAQSAPVYSNGYFYYTRFDIGSEYPVYYRRKGNMDAPEEILLNVNEMAASHLYFNLGSYDVSFDNRLVAFSVDTVGRRQFTIKIKNLETGEISRTGIANAAGNMVWAADNATLFYGTIDPKTLRFDRIMRYNIINRTAPVQVYYEADETFYHMGLSRTKDDRYISITINSTLTNETWLLPSNQPQGSFRVFQPRKHDVLYEVFPMGDNFYILTNYEAKNFRLMQTPAGQTAIENWTEVVAHRPDVLLENIELFNDFLVLQERIKGLRQLRIMHLTTGEEHYLPFEEEAYTVSIGANFEMESQLLRYNYTSLTTPVSQFDYNMTTREKTLVKQQEVLGDFDPANYQTRRFFVRARDGVEVPVTLVYRLGMQKNGRNPLLLHGYGSYGSSLEPRFNSNILSLLDRGFIFAQAHIRGGQELGRHWYEDGKLLNKRNTFYDFIDIADHLVAENYTNPGALFASGGSAGGLLMGAVINMRPELFRGVIAAVPFVDIVTTMLDETIPLTTAEYDEWGNPNYKEYYEYMLSYSPYDNVTSQAYPNLLVTSGLHDSQVQFWEPTKWVAKLRHYNTGDNKILLFTNLEAGHGGASGRFHRLREIAREYAFLLNLVGKRR